MTNEYSRTGKSWHLVVSAACAVLLLIVVAVSQVRDLMRGEQTMNQPEAGQFSHPSTDAANELAATLGLPAPGATSSTPEAIANIGTSTLTKMISTYATIAQNGAYTPEIGERIAASVAPSLDARVPYAMFDPQSVATSPDTSFKAMLAYRAALQTSLAPLQLNKKYELGLYNEYMQTHDAAILAELKTAAQHYYEAVALTSHVTAPADARLIQVGILNAMQQFGATLDLIADNINNPVTSLALLVSYSRAEDGMTNAFTALDAYYTSKQP